MSEMSDEKFYANLANEAYKRKDRKMEFEGYIHNNELSDTRHAIYHNPDKNHTVLAVRGTRTDLSQDSIEDLGTDLTGIVFGNLTSERRYKQAQEKLKQAQEKYKGSRVDVTGHSLGGAVATSLAEREKGINEAHVFNAGAFAPQALRDIECQYSMSTQCKNRKKRVVRYNIEGDVLSLASHTDKGVKKHIYKKPKKGLDPHTIRNFID